MIKKPLYDAQNTNGHHNEARPLEYETKRQQNHWTEVSGDQHHGILSLDPPL